VPTYEEYEQSVQDSLPIEGYKFIGTFKTYRYTSADQEQIINGETYTPVAVTRSNVKAGTHEDDSISLDLELPFDTDVIIDYAFSQTPPKLRLVVYRLQAEDVSGTAWSIYWTGLVRGFSANDRGVKIQVPSIFSLALQGEVTNAYYQVPCNHLLYGPRCTVSADANKFVTTVQTYEGTSISVIGEPTTADDLKGGEIVNPRNGERRLIMANSGSSITIGYQFVDLQPGDEVWLYRGCDHSLETCKTKFNNVINHGGFKYIPPDSPFEGSIT
jgi:hypothetical protein